MSENSATYTLRCCNCSTRATVPCSNDTEWATNVDELIKLAAEAVRRGWKLKSRLSNYANGFAVQFVCDTCVLNGR